MQRLQSAGQEVCGYLTAIEGKSTIAFGADVQLNKLQEATYQRSVGIFAVCVMDLLGIERV